MPSQNSDFSWSLPKKSKIPGDSAGELLTLGTVFVKFYRNGKISVFFSLKQVLQKRRFSGKLEVDWFLCRPLGQVGKECPGWWWFATIIGAARPTPTPLPAAAQPSKAIGSPNRKPYGFFLSHPNKTHEEKGCWSQLWKKLPWLWAATATCL